MFLSMLNSQCRASKHWRLWAYWVAFVNLIRSFALNQFDDTAVCKSCNDDLLSEKFYPKSSSIGGRKISPQKLFKSIADTLQVSQGKWVGSAKGILPMLIICVDIPKLLGLGSAKVKRSEPCV